MSDAAPPKRASAALIILLVVAGGVCFLLLPFIGIVAAIAIPNFLTMQMKAKRSEIPANVDGIKTAELSYDAAFDEFISVSSRREAEAELAQGGGEQRPWRGGSQWEKLGWRPDGTVRGVYWVEASSDQRSFTVYGLCDVDGDGDYAEFKASDEANARMTTPAGVY
ncbi:MAG: hypothetical protein Q8P41_11550 [Pseudomonadota bacterium]|nr:hypothetical protein [Pseudomonadota bacterium]